MLNLHHLWNSNSRCGQPRELVVKLSPGGEVPGKNEQRHSPQVRAGLERPCLGPQLIQFGFEILLALQSDYSVHDLAVLEEEQGGDGVDAILDREILVVVDVHLADLHLAVVLSGEFVKDWGDHFAGATPFGPEIDQDWLGGFGNFLFKISGGQSDDVRC